MRRWLIWAISLLVGVVAIALAVPLALTTGNAERSRFIQELEIETLGTASILASQGSVDWQSTVDATAQRTGARVVVVNAEGVLIADSDDTELGRPFDRPEITQALQGALVVDVRPSTTLGGDLRSVAAPVVQDLSVVAAVRLSLLEDAVDAEVHRTQLWLALFVLAVLAAAVGIAWLLARWIGAPLERLSAVAHALPDDLSMRADAADGPAEVRAVASALNTTANRLEGLVERTRRVAADASHHLRTPLTGVRLRLEAIEDLSDQASVREEAIAATSEVDRLTRRIGQILDLARSDARATTGAAADASSIVADRVEAAAVIADEREVVLVSQIADDLVAAVDAGVLARIVDELLGNAFAYAQGQVRVELASTGDGLLLTVEDDGPGAPDGELEAIFARFTRGTSAVPGGSGLGLALVRESVRAVGGEATAARSDLGGLLVEVRLPRARR